MKAYCMIALLTLFGQIILPHGFPQVAEDLLDPPQVVEDLPHPSVRVIYFLPKDRQPQPDIDIMLDTLIKQIQTFYADEMERHGFGRKTFRLETDKNGQVVVHHVKGEFRSSHYNNNINVAAQTVLPEIKQRYDTLNNIYLTVADLGQSLGGYAFEGIPLTTTQGNFNALNSQTFGDQFVMTAHELGHIFGLEHDFRKGAYLMSYGVKPDRLSKCAAEWLDVHPYFNDGTAQINTDHTIQLLSSTLASPDAIRLRFQVENPDGLHQAHLIIPVNSRDPAPGFKLDGCYLFENGSETIEFLSTELMLTPQSEVTLRVIDKSGKVTSQTFPIDVTSILPPPKFVSIPDPNLATALRKALGLGKNAPISQRALRSLKVLPARDSQITDLSGLKHATQLESLYLEDVDGINGNNNNLSDITPLKNLTQLRQLSLAYNNVSDITPLKNLTELVELDLFSNNVGDITPLKNLTQLKYLRLGRNPISDITPLKNLTQLETLSLYFSRNVSDITVLANITELKNLTLGGTTISDVTPLKNLTKLESLNLSHNNISDITPLTNLTGLEVLFLEGNPIKNHARLLVLLRRKPDMKIYLKEGGEPLPVSLSSFRAELTPTGVVLKWVTQSEVDNAGFYILRSESRDGTFKVVNPTLIQGAGTTSERHTYTWTDTTAKPNAAYYYRIEDISHAGVRKQLATVRMKGLVSANGKLTTMWADLKTLR